MKLYLIAPTYEELHANSQILTSLGWTVFDLRDVMRFAGIEINALPGSEQPPVAMVRELAALEMIGCRAVVLHDDIDSGTAFGHVQACRYMGKRCVMLSTLLEDTRVSEELLDAHNIATIELPEEAKTPLSARERVEKMVKALNTLTRFLATKNPVSRERQLRAYPENDTVTHTG